MIKFGCDSLRSYGNRLKICLRLLALAVASSRRDRKFSISATHCDLLRSVAINGNHCSQFLQLVATIAVLFLGLISLPSSTFHSSGSQKLQLLATHCDSLRLLAIIWKPLLRVTKIATPCDSLQLLATPCDSL